MSPVIEQTIGELVSQIVRTAHPMRIILFGSAARGNMGPDSDIDLLVVMPKGSDSNKVSKLLYSRVGGVDRDFDMVVTTPDVLEKYKDNCGLVYKWALQEGREVYAA